MNMSMKIVLGWTIVFSLLTFSHADNSVLHTYFGNGVANPSSLIIYHSSEGSYLGGNGTAYYSYFSCRDTVLITSAPNSCRELEMVGQCSFAGRGNPADFGSFTLTAQWNRPQTNVEDTTSWIQFSNHAIRVDLASNDGHEIYAGPLSIPFECVFTVYSDHDVTHNYSDQSGKTFRFSDTFIVENTYGFTVSVPTHITGLINDTSVSTFDITTTGVNDAYLTWSVQHPCSEWNPTLSSATTGTPHIPADGITPTRIYNGVENMTASFTPTEAGEFSCPGVLTFSLP